MLINQKPFIPSKNALKIGEGVHTLFTRYDEENQTVIFKR